MSTDPTEPQGGRELHRAREMSLKRGCPPTQVPGYEPERFLGLGAYGEVWVAVERNTGRRVAIKFYAHRGGLDWSLLSREVEKLSFLFADRYVVQLLGVGWDAEPPYYIMEYLEHGSLAERLQQGPLPARQSVELFRDVAVGLMHAHGKGVLHCDLKPANILLDQDHRPRLADFGQSRLSHEQVPALGTLFYMAPEQADLEALPDARWDVYALGALLYCMLTGAAPHRTPQAIEQFEQTTDLRQRLASYRQMIEGAPPPSAHRQVRGVDGDLAEIIDRCLAADPQSRYPNVQAVLDALARRDARRARRPMMVLGAVGPALLLAVVSWFAWQGFTTAVEQSDQALTESALQSNDFAAQYAARTAGNELERRFSMVEQVAASQQFRQAVREFLGQAGVREMLAALSDPALKPAERERLRVRFRELPERQRLQAQFAALIPPSMRPSDEEEVASWFYCDPCGVSTVRVGKGDTVGKNFAWRSFFHGGNSDQPEHWRPQPAQHVQRTGLSAVFRSQATQSWIVAVTTPVFGEPTGGEFLGVVAMTVELGRFVELQSREEDAPDGDDRFAVLVDLREGENRGVVLQHPLLNRLLADQGTLPDRFKNCRVAASDLPDDGHSGNQRHYADSLAADVAGADYYRHWLAQMEPVCVRGEDTGWVVIVQEAYDAAIGATLRRLQTSLICYGLLALVLVALLMAGLWGFVTRRELV